MQRAGQLLAIGLGLAMIDDGWELHLQPGVFRFQRGAQEFNPFGAVDDLMKGNLSRDAWIARCRELGLSQLPLFPQSGVVTAT
jgi:hypothetical protein